MWAWLLVVPSAFDSSTGHYGLTNKMSEHEKSNIRLSTMSGFRTDTRRSMDARPVNLEVAVLPDAFGSSPGFLLLAEHTATSLLLVHISVACLALLGRDFVIPLAWSTYTAAAMCTPGSARVRMGRTDVLAAVKAEFSKPYPTGRIGPGPLVFHVDLRGIDGEGTSSVTRDDDVYVEDYAINVCRTLEVVIEEECKT